MDIAGKTSTRGRLTTPLRMRSVQRSTTHLDPGRLTRPWLTTSSLDSSFRSNFHSSSITHSPHSQSSSAPSFDLESFTNQWYSTLLHSLTQMQPIDINRLQSESVQTYNQLTTPTYPPLLIDQLFTHDEIKLRDEILNINPLFFSVAFALYIPFVVQVKAIIEIIKVGDQNSDSNSSNPNLDTTKSEKEKDNFMMTLESALDKIGPQFFDDTVNAIPLATDSNGHPIPIETRFKYFLQLWQEVESKLSSTSSLSVPHGKSNHQVLDMVDICNILAKVYQVSEFRVELGIDSGTEVMTSGSLGGTHHGEPGVTEQEHKEQNGIQQDLKRRGFI